MNKFRIFILITIGIQFTSLRLYSQNLSAKDSSIVTKLLSYVDHFKANDNPSATAKYLEKTAFIYWKNNQSESAINYYKEAADLYQKANNEKSYASVCSNLAQIYSDTNNKSEALTYLNKAENVYKTLNLNSYLIDIYKDKAVLLKLSKQYSASIAEAEKALALSEKENDYDDIKECYGMLSEIHKAAGNDAKSLEYFNKFMGFDHSGSTSYATSNQSHSHQSSTSTTKLDNYQNNPTENNSETNITESENITNQNNNYQNYADNNSTSNSSNSAADNTQIIANNETTDIAANDSTQISTNNATISANSIINKFSKNKKKHRNVIIYGLLFLFIIAFITFLISKKRHYRSKQKTISPPPIKKTVSEKKAKPEKKELKSTRKTQNSKKHQPQKKGKTATQNQKKLTVSKT